MKPCTIGVGKPHENGDVESGQGVLKRRVEQHLLLRGSRDFDSEAAYVGFLEEVMEKANGLRQKRLGEELAAMRILDVRLFPEYREVAVRVTSWGTVQVERNTYSVPGRLIGEKGKGRVYEDRVELYFHGERQWTAPRLLGEGKHEINYRHVIGWLVRKPGAFRRYRYREAMFPSEVFLWAYDRLSEVCSERVADLEYLRILHHAAQNLEAQVEQVLRFCRAQGQVPRWKTVEEQTPALRPQLPELAPLVVDLGEYDRLLSGQEVCA